MWRNVGSYPSEAITSTHFGIRRFLHASLQLDALCHCLSAHHVKKIIEQFPSEIKDVYSQTWRRILNQHSLHVDLAKTILLWVVYAARPMTIDELRCAVATSPDKDEFEPARMVPEATLLGLCQGLVVLEEESRLVRLVREYLVSRYYSYITPNVEQITLLESPYRSS
jgi:hypothetical protein